MEKTTKITLDEEDIKKIKESAGVSCEIDGLGLCFNYGFRSRDQTLIEKNNLRIKSIIIEYYEVEE